MTDEQILSILRAPMKRIEWRLGSTSKDGRFVRLIPYIDQREAHERLDHAFGLRYSTDYRQCDEGVICRITAVLPDGFTVHREEVAGYPVSKEHKLASDMRFKGAASDSLKRCLHAFSAGRQLYYLPKYWIPYNPEISYIPNRYLPKSVDWNTLEIIPAPGCHVGFPPSAGKVTSSSEPPPLAPNNQDTANPLCSNCNQKLSPAELDYSMRRYNAPLCRRCQTK